MADETDKVDGHEAEILVPIPRGRPFMLVVFRGPGVAVADVQTSGDIDPGQLQAFGAWCKAKANFIWNNKFMAELVAARQEAERQKRIVAPLTPPH